ncbi:MAG: winged helix-turn-helix transcriptional regulator [Clostridia bacterium]|nr:winged helix-turn-helix transcriptional regulator [Clostridia bacterium]
MDFEKQKILIKKSEMLKIIAHPMRLCILNCLKSKPYQVNELAEHLGLPQSTVSQHLSKMRLKDIVDFERDGVMMNYYIKDSEVVAIIDLLISNCEQGVFSESVG